MKDTKEKNKEKHININFPEAEDMNQDISSLGVEENNQIKDDFIENNISVSNDEIKKLISERNELREQVLRIAAELENFRKRVIREKQEMLEYANEKLLLKLLPLIDDMSSAIEAGNQSNDYQGLLKGIEMIFSKAKKIFEEVGVKPMENPVGSQFDVELQESLMHIPSKEPEGQILQLVQQGYMLNDKVLRYAKVITSAGSQEKEKENKE